MAAPWGMPPSNAAGGGRQDPVSPRSGHFPRLSFGQTSAAPIPEEEEKARSSNRNSDPYSHRPSLSRFTFPARQSWPNAAAAGRRPSEFNSGNSIFGNNAYNINNNSNGGANGIDDSVGLAPEDVPQRPSSTGDIGGDIQFRAPAPPVHRPSVRTLYSNNAVPGSTFSASPAYASRKQSLVNPEDYRPGLPSGSNGGRAMTAGFEQSVPDVTSRIREARANIALERKTSESSLATFRSAMSTHDRPLSALSQNLDVDLGDPDSIQFHKDEDEDDFDEKGSSSPVGSDHTTMPTVYNNAYIGPLAVSYENNATGRASVTPGNDRRRSSVVPRDPVTGKVDWRARLQMRPRESISLESGGSEKNVIWEATSASSPMSEKTFGGGKYIESKPTPAIVSIENDKYTALGRMLLRLSPLTFVISVAATNIYLYLRARAIMNAHAATGNMFTSAWLFYAFECVFATLSGFRMFYKLINMSFQTKPRLLLKGDFALPNVDVLILATGQDPAMVMDATVAAARLDWPVDKLRVLVVDETRSDTLKHMIEQYSNLRAIHVTYHQRSAHARAPRGGVWPKSSTINYGLSETRAEGRIAGQYTIVLEAESIAEPGLLRGLLPHLINDPVLALVQSPSAFYNLPKNLSSNFATFINCVEPVQDSRSAFAMRRAAVDDIGGFPTKSSIEDKRLELLLKGKGYSTLFLDESLAYSVVPSSFSKHFRQRVDRVLAHFKTAARLGFFVFSKRIGHLSFIDRLCGLGRGLAPFLSIIVALTSIALPVALAFGGFLVPALTLTELNTMLWAALAMILTEKLHDFCFAMPSGEDSTRVFVRSQVFMAPYLVLGLVRNLIPDFLCRAPEKYWVSSEPGAKDERNLKLRKPFSDRLLSVTLGSHGWTHLALIMGILATIGYSLYQSIVVYARNQRGLHQTALFVLMTVAWPTLPWMDLLLGSLTPFIYAVRPPTVPSREALLHREPISGKASPLDEYKRMRPYQTNFWRQTVLSVILVAYACTVFALTFVKVNID